MDWSNMFSGFMPSEGSMGWGLPATLLGVGVGGDIFNAIQRQKVYDYQKQAMQQQQQMAAQQSAFAARQAALQQTAADPNYWKTFYTPASDAYLQNLTRDVNAGLALRGVESGGEANMAISRAMAEQELQRQQQAMGQANTQLQAQYNALMGASNTLGGASASLGGGATTAGNMGRLYGQGGGGFSSALGTLPWLMLMPGMMQNNKLQNQLLQRNVNRMNDTSGQTGDTSVFTGSGIPGYGGPAFAGYGGGPSPYYKPWFSGGGSSPDMGASEDPTAWDAGLGAGT